MRVDLERWLNRERLELGVSHDQVSPQLDLWEDSSDVGLGAHLGDDFAFGLWPPADLKMSINATELLAMERALEFFAPLLQNSSVAMFADNSTAIAYLQNQEGTRSPLLNAIAQRILRWAESCQMTLTPQFIMGCHNVLVDSLSCLNQVLGSEWTLKTEVFQELRKRWLVTIDLVATSLSVADIQYIFLRSTIRTPWRQMLCSRIGMGGRSMPFHLGHLFQRFSGSSGHRLESSLPL